MDYVMTKNTNQKTTKKHSKLFNKVFKGNGILWAGLIFFSIPLIILAVILLQSSLATGNVIEGNRFNNDLEPEITSAMLDNVTSSLEELDVQTVNVSLHAATLIVTLKVDPALEAESFADIATEAVELVDSHIAIDTYFTSTDAKKMYDLQIDVYNLSMSDDSVNLHTILTKNGNMSTWAIQDVSTAVNPDLAAELIAKMEAKNNPVEETTNVPTDSTNAENTDTTGE